MPIFNVFPNAEMGSLPKEYTQLRRESDAKSIIRVPSAPYLRNTHNYAAFPTPRGRRPPTSHTPSGAANSWPPERLHAQLQCIPRAEMWSLPKEYTQLRRESDAKSIIPRAEM